MDARAELLVRVSNVLGLWEVGVDRQEGLSVYTRKWQGGFISEKRARAAAVRIARELGLRTYEEAHR